MPLELRSALACRLGLERSPLSLTSRDLVRRRSAPPVTFAGTGSPCGPVSRLGPSIASKLPPAEPMAMGTRFVWIDLLPGGSAQASPLWRCCHRLSVPDHAYHDAAGYAVGLPAYPSRWPDAPVSVSLGPRGPDVDAESEKATATHPAPCTCHRLHDDVFQHSELLRIATSADQRRKGVSKARNAKTPAVRSGGTNRGSRGILGRCLVVQVTSRTCPAKVTSYHSLSS